MVIDICQNLHIVLEDIYTVDLWIHCLKINRLPIDIKWHQDIVSILVRSALISSKSPCRAESFRSWRSLLPFSMYWAINYTVLWDHEPKDGIQREIEPSNFSSDSEGEQKTSLWNCHIDWRLTWYAVRLRILSSNKQWHVNNIIFSELEKGLVRGESSTVNVKPRELCFCRSQWIRPKSATNLK